MDDFFALILFVIFLLVPILEQIRKKNQPPAPPKDTPTTGRPLPRSTTEEISIRNEREPASVMVPDDLWQVLTGEARPPARAPAETPQPARPKPPWDVIYIPPEETDEQEWEDREIVLEDVTSQVERTTRDHERWHEVRPAVSLETEPVIVSLEAQFPSSAARHSSFHDRILREEAARPVPFKPADVLPRTRKELQRAFILKEVLGTPRGLD